MKKRHAEIVGAGIAGLTAAASLAQRGWSVRIHERGEELREIGAGIFVWENGLRVLETVHAFDDAVREAERLTKTQMCGKNKKVIAEEIFPEHQRAYTLLRTDLHRALAIAAIAAGVQVEVSSNVVAAEPDGTIILENGKRFKSDLVVGADGVHSKIRESCELAKEVVLKDEGILRVLIPRKESDLVKMATENWSGMRRVGVVPCNPKYIYLWLYCPEKDKAGSVFPLNKQSWIDSYPYLEDYIQRIGECGPGRRDRLSNITCKAWSKGKVAIVGDAAFAMPPNLGQGAGLAMTNALALAAEVSSSSEVSESLLNWEIKQRSITDLTQRWSNLYGKVSGFWPKSIMGLRVPFIRMTTRTKRVQYCMSAAEQAFRNEWVSS